jgi:predicted DNA-binding transcriptional regulator AlpA
MNAQRPVSAAIARTRPAPPVIPLAAEHFDKLPDSARVDVRTIAAVEGVSVASVWRWVSAGILPKPEPKAPGTNSTRWMVGKIRQARSDRAAA